VKCLSLIFEKQFVDHMQNIKLNVTFLFCTNCKVNNQLYFSENFVAEINWFHNVMLFNNRQGISYVCLK